MRHTIPALALLIAIPMTTSLLLACGDDNGSNATPTEPSPAPQATAPAPTPTAAAPVATPGPSTPNELGETPVFWRTPDGFASLTAGKGYKALFRITNGYAEETLRIVAEPAAGDGQPVEFISNKAIPGEGEAPGSYYPTEILLPEPGTWTLTVFAGEDEVSLTVTVAPAG